MRELKLGLALGAGGTKGAAHVGVLQVLREAGIRIDAIAGTSIGSLYGGAFAAGYDIDEMAEGIRTCPPGDVIAFFRHRLRLRHDNRLARRFYDALAGHNIEQLPLTFAATASDIVERCHVTIDRGPLIDAIEASIAIPLIARPVAHQGRYLVDGGFWDSAPVDAAGQLGVDVIVAVELGRPFKLPINLHTPASWLSARMAKARAHRTMAGIGFSMHAFARELVPGREADLVIRPGVPHLRGNSPYHMARCLDAGIDAGRAALPAIRALLAGEPVPAPAEAAVPSEKKLQTARHSFA